MRQFRQAWLIPLFGIVMAAAGTALAGSDHPVIELFTSQGCSSCPAADRLFKSYAERDDVVALSYNVDYWDYLGWKDTLARPEFSERQRAYASQRGDGAVYTPQIVVNGLAHAIGSRSEQIKLALAKTRASLAGRHVTIKVELPGNDLLIISVDATATPPEKPATIWIASVRPEVTVKIRRGENRGKSVTYHNVVRELSAVGMWSGGQTTLKLQKHPYLVGPAKRCAVFVQSSAGAILGARWLTLADGTGTTQ